MNITHYTQFVGMRGGSECFCSGALEKATWREDTDCNVDCLDDPSRKQTEMRRKFGNFLSMETWGKLLLG